MAEIRTGPAAADAMAKWKTYPARLCLQAVSRAFQRGTATQPSQIEPLVSVLNARAHWEATPAKYRHPGESNAPKGALISMGNGDGHIVISMGGGKAVSTDYPEKGKVSVASINDILRHFSGNPLLGWSTWINGRPIKGIATAGLSAERKAQVKKIAAYLNKHAKNLGLPTTTASSDGIPGSNYWRLVQALGRTWGFYTGAVDGIPGTLTYKAETRIWDKYVNVSKPAPAPAPVEPVPDETPEPGDSAGDGSDAEPDTPIDPDPIEEEPMPETPQPSRTPITDEQLAELLALAAAAEQEPADKTPIIPDALAKPLWIVLALVGVSVGPIVGLSLLDYANWDAETGTQFATTVGAWTGLIAATLGLSRFAKTK